MIFKVKIKVILRPRVSRPVRLGVRHPSGTRDQFFFFLEICLDSFGFVILLRPLWGEDGSVILLLLVLARAVPVLSESRRTQDRILLSQFLRLPQPGGPGPRIYISQEECGPDIPPGTGFPFHRLLRLAGLRWRYSIPPPHGKSCLLVLTVIQITFTQLNRISQQTNASPMQRFILLVLLKETVTKNSGSDKEHISRDLLIVSFCVDSDDAV
jgi:hypothetical protein